jgi:hypothetical protein
MSHTFVLIGSGEHPVAVDIIDRHFKYLDQFPADCDLYDQ